MPLAIDRLGEIARFLQTADGPYAEWLTEAVAAVRLGATLEAALKIAHGYTSNCRRSAQDAALAGLVAALPDCRTANARAHRIAAQIARYESTRWPQDRDNKRRPDGVDGHLFDLLMAHAPTSERSLRRLPMLAKNDSDLANGSGG